MLVMVLMAPLSVSALSLDDSRDGTPLGDSLFFLKDETQQMGIEEVRHASANGLFKAIMGGAEPNFSYTHAALWLYTPLTNESNEAHWMLELSFAQLDDVEFYLIDKTTGTTLTHYRTGDTHPFAERPLAHRNFVFPVALAPQGSYELYLRIRSEGTLTLPLVAWKASTFNLASRNAYMAMMLYFGLLLAFFSYNLRLYFSLQDRLYLYYLGYIASFALAIGAWNGLFFEYLWPDLPRWGNIAAEIGYNLTGLFGAIFSRKFLDSRTFSPLLDRIMNYCSWGFAMLVVVTLLGYYQLVSILTSATGIIFAVTAVTSGVYCLHRGQRSARYFLLAWTLLLLGTAIMGARSFGLIPSNTFTRSAMQFGSIIDILLLSFALSERITNLRRDKERAEEEALVTKRSMVELLERTEQELERRVVERTQDLTALNQRLKEQEQRLTGLAMYDALTGLANRTLLDERIDEALSTRVQRTDKVALLLIDHVARGNQATVRHHVDHAVGDQAERGNLEQLLAVRARCAGRVAADLQAEALRLRRVVGHTRVRFEGLRERVLVVAAAEVREHAAGRGARRARNRGLKRGVLGRLLLGGRQGRRHRRGGRVGVVHARDVAAPLAGRAVHAGDQLGGREAHVGGLQSGEAVALAVHQREGHRGPAGCGIDGRARERDDDRLRLGDRDGVARAARPGRAHRADAP